VGRTEPCPPGLDGLAALVAYEGTGRRLVSSLKYANRRGGLEWLGAALAAQAEIAFGALDPRTVLTWVPASAARRRRGFDQAALVARPTARHLRLPARGLLVRQDGASQTGRSRAERLGAPPLVARTGHLSGPVVVVDDVCTTGATLRSAAGALRAAGATRVLGLTVARADRWV
jgi:predicted amidophosphoribosyltransferase